MRHPFPSNSANDQTVQTVQEADVCASVVPLGLDEPNFVWRHGAVFAFYKNSNCPENLKRDLISCFLSEQDALRFRARFREFILEDHRSPYLHSYEEAVQEAKSKRMPLAIVDGQGREVCR